MDPHSKDSARLPQWLCGKESTEPKQSKIIRISTNNEKKNFIQKRQKSQKIHSLEPYYNPLNRNKMGLMKGQKNITVIKGKGENHRKYSKEKR